jgi:anthranilate synthase component II
MLTIIDNYDSFTYNLVHYLGDLGVETEVYRNDEKSAAWVLTQKPEAIVMSPGPCTPNEAGICLELVKKNKGRIPLLGVCLGHQTIGQAYGGRVIRAPVLMHGKLSRIHHEGTSLFRGLPDGFEATRYHSLIVEAETLPASLAVTAHTGDGLIMALEHRSAPVFGVQFHPESIASANGHAILANFLTLAGIKWEAKKKGLNLPNLEPARSRAAVA